MARKEASLRFCMFVQQLDEKYFPQWTDEERKSIAIARSGNIALFVSVIGARLFNAGLYCDEMHGIIHDADVVREWDETIQDYREMPKAVHAHVVLHFKRDEKVVQSTLTNIALAIGTEKEFIVKPKRGGRYDNMLAYLIHIKYANKHQYDPKSVFSYGLTDKDGKNTWTPYMDYYERNKDTWLKGRGTIKCKSAEENIDMLEEMILTGQVTKAQVVLTDEYYEIYSRYCRRCEDAFRVYGERRAYKTLQALQNGDFKLCVFYIVGDPGAGKTRLAKEFVRQLIEKSKDWTGETWRVCQTAASNPMDEYNGEEILLMDDVRGAALSASDWLKLLDPYNISPSSARYHNKVPACRAVVITSTKEPVEFFYYCKQMGGGDRSEALDQFMRRIQMLTHVIKADDFNDVRAQIAEVKEGDKRLVEVPNSASRGGENVKLPLACRFDYGSNEYSVDEAITKMVNTVDENTTKTTGTKNV
jgi:hypothetical protein